MEAYKVLNKKSSRDEYDATITMSQHSNYSNPPPGYSYQPPPGYSHYSSPFRREKRFYEGYDWQEQINNLNKQGYSK